MAVKLLVKRIDSDAPSTEHSFVDQDMITIGRDATADVTLFDDDMMVSRLHARLELEGDTYQLSDLGSRNFTSIDNEHLVPGQLYPLHNEQVFHVANYEIQFFKTQPPPRDFGETRFDVGFVNPFIVHVGSLVQTIESMQKEFDKLPDVRKEAALSEALKEAHIRLGGSSVFSQIWQSEEPQMDPIARSRSDEGEGVKGIEPKPGTEPLHGSAPVSTDSPGQAEAPRSPVLSGPSPGKALDLSGKERSRLDRLVDYLVDFASKQVKIPWQFRYEFVGHTFIPSEDSKGIYESDQQGLLDFLFDTGCSADELDRRMVLVQEALEEVLAHQMAVLDGYRAAVTAGTELMLEQMDPEVIQVQLQGENPIFKYLPFLIPFRGWAILAEKHADMAQEDISVLERRTYRPAFIKSYLERATSIQNIDS